MLESPEVYTELVSLMLSGHDIATSRFRLVRSEHYIATAWYFFTKKIILRLWSSYYLSTSPTFSFHIIPSYQEHVCALKG